MDGNPARRPTGQGVAPHSVRRLRWSWPIALNACWSVLRLGQGYRVVCQSVQVIDDVGTLLGARNSSERHCRALNGTARVHEKFVELIERPISALRLHRRRIVVARF